MATASWFVPAMEGQFGTTAARRVDWVTDTIKVALTTVAYTPDVDLHDFFADVTDEVVGTGYTAGGVTLAGKSVTKDAATNEVRLIAANAEWLASTITARRAIVYKDTGVAATSPLLGQVDFGGNEVTSNATFRVTWDAIGVLKITLPP